LLEHTGLVGLLKNYGDAGIDIGHGEIGAPVVIPVGDGEEGGTSAGVDVLRS
jgi:hypothetical protein